MRTNLVCTIETPNIGCMIRKHGDRLRTSRKRPEVESYCSRVAIGSLSTTQCAGEPPQSASTCALLIFSAE